MEKIKCSEHVQKIILNQHLVVSDPAISIVNQISLDNTFKNPKFYEAEKYGHYTGGIPSQIQTYRYSNNSIIVDRGYWNDFQTLLKDNNIEVSLEEERSCPPASFPDLKNITLRSYQAKAVEEAEKCEQGVIVAPTGAGKTIIGLEIIKRKATPTLILVHKKELAEQWVKEIKKLLGIEPGFIGSGKWNIAEITIALVQSLSKNEERCRDIADKFGLVLCDECHHAPAEMFSRTIASFTAKYRYGLSATPSRRDGLDFLISRVIGPEIIRIPKEDVESGGCIIPVQVKIVNTKFTPHEVENWSSFIGALNNPERNALILSLISNEKSFLILVDRINHAEDLSKKLEKDGVEHVLAHGKLPVAERSTLMDRIKKSPITIGTTGLLGEGLDVSHWDVLVLGSPISSEIKLLQAIGRIVRPSKDKHFGLVYDLRDDCGFAGHSLKIRLNIYRKRGIKIELNNV